MGPNDQVRALVSRLRFVEADGGACRLAGLGAAGSSGAAYGAAGDASGEELAAASVGVEVEPGCEGGDDGAWPQPTAPTNRQTARARVSMALVNHADGEAQATKAKEGALRVALKP